MWDRSLSLSSLPTGVASIHPEPMRLAGWHSQCHAAFATRLRLAEVATACGSSARIEAESRPYADGADPCKRAGAVG